MDQERFNKLVELRMDSSQTVIGMQRMRERCDGLGLDEDTMSRLSQAQTILELFSRGVAVELCIERGILKGLEATLDD